MSKIGKKNILIPKESSIKIEGGNLTISGPKGTKKLTINEKIFSSKLIDSKFEIQPLEKKIDKRTSIMWGTYRSLINNAVTGVSKGHEKILRNVKFKHVFTDHNLTLNPSNNRLQLMLRLETEHIPGHSPRHSSQSQPILRILNFDRGVTFTVSRGGYSRTATAIDHPDSSVINNCCAYA